MTNTTPLINLAGIELLDLLTHLYGEVWAPRIVVEEYQVKAPSTQPNLAHLSWLRVVENVPIDPLFAQLDDGEAAALSLARIFDARLVLLDERRARRMATRVGLPVAGTLAVLLRAKEQGIIAAVRPYVTQMQNQGRRLHPDLAARFLKDAGE